MEDGRRSYAALAPVAGLSQAATRVRVQRLIDDRIIDINARIDPGLLGFGVFAFAMVCTKGRVDRVAAAITEIPEAVFLVRTAGRCDLLVELRTRDNASLISVLDRIRSIDQISDVESLIVLRYAKQDWSNVGAIPDVEASPPSQPEWPSSNTIDDVDLQLIHGLIADGRASFTELAAVVGLSHAAVRDRVIRLLNGALTVQATPGPGATDHLVWSGLMVTLSAEADKVTATLTDRGELTIVALSAGRFGVVCEARADDLDHLQDLVEWIRTVDGVARVEPLHYLEIVKQEFGGGAV
jgi:DNA-binding Lrp family transcriptional regulator